MKVLSGNANLKFNYALMIVSHDTHLADYLELKNWCIENCQGMFFISKCNETMMGSPTKYNGATPFDGFVIEPIVKKFDEVKSKYYILMLELEEDAVLFKTTYS